MKLSSGGSDKSKTADVLQLDSEAHQSKVSLADPLALALQQERERIAREIHDGVSQNLALLMLKVEIITRLADSDRDRMEEELAKVQSILEITVDELRQTIDRLRTP